MTADEATFKAVAPDGDYAQIREFESSLRMLSILLCHLPHRTTIDFRANSESRVTGQHNARTTKSKKRSKIQEIILKP